MNIGLYIEHGVGNGIGGAELMMASVGSLWSQAHHVDFIHHRETLTRERFELFSTDDYSRLNFRFVPREAEPSGHGNLFRRLRDARDWHATVSDGYDVFVNCTHWLPCFSRAKTSTLLVLFPFYVRPTSMVDIRALPQWKRLRHRGYHDLEWKRRIATYDHLLSISRFSAEWTRRRWGISPDVVYPPVDLIRGDGAKDALILSVGRFSTMAHTKKQLELMAVFSAFRAQMPGWAYTSVGGLNTRPENRAYLERVKSLGESAGARVEANLPRAELKGLFQRARIYWHATGLGESPEDRPELLEHFGISIVEAMAAGCVPVVINRGGAAEIVEHGRTGFLWNTIDELRFYTSLLAKDEVLWARMSAAALVRAQIYGRERFFTQLAALCGIDGDIRRHA